MSASQFWKNFNLGHELSISGAFIYNGVRRFYEMRRLDNPDEIFEALYNLAVGFERLLKVAIVLLEHQDGADVDLLEDSLRTHSHLELLGRVTKHSKLKIGTPHHDLLALLATFYKTFRYDRFTLASAYDTNKEKGALLAFLSKHLNVELNDDHDTLFGIPNEPRYRKFMLGLVRRVASALYQVVRERAAALNLYTFELRSGSRAETIFLGEADLPTEDVLWKELLIFFMNTQSTYGAVGFLRRPPDFE